MKYVDPDGKVVKDTKTTTDLDKVRKTSDRKTKIIIPSIIKDIIEKDLVQGSVNLPKRYKHIGDFSYIGAKTHLEEWATSDLLENADNPEMLVTSVSWYDEDAMITITEYLIYSYDKESETTGPQPYQVYIDVGDDGYIDYAQYVPYDLQN